MRPVVILVFALISFKSVPQKQFERLDTLAFYYVKNNDYVKAENTALETIQLSNGKNSSIYLINAHTILGIINKNRGYFHSSVENYLSAMKHAENISDSARVSACLNNIGVIYKLQNKYKDAIKYFEKSLQLEENLSNELQKSIRFYNLADAYLELDSLNLALSYFTNSLIVEQKNNNLEGALYASIGLGNVYLKRKDLVNLDYLIDDLRMDIGAATIELKIAFQQLVAQFFLGKGDLSSADRQIDSALLLTNKYELNYLDLPLLRVKLNVQERLKNWESVADIYRQYLSLSERLNSDQINQRVDELNYNYQLQKKQVEIDKLQQEKMLEEIRREESENLRLLERRLIIYILVVIAFISSFIVLTLKKFSRFSK